MRVIARKIKSAHIGGAFLLLTVSKMVIPREDDNFIIIYPRRDLARECWTHFE